MILSLKGSRRALSDPRVLWAIQRHLIKSPSGVVAFQVGQNIKGEVLHKQGQSSQIINLIKAKVSTQGEIDAHLEIIEVMKRAHSQRNQKLSKDLDLLLRN